MTQEIELLTLTAADAQSRLSNGETTSVHLVELYLKQIEAHNHQGLHLNAFISIAPREKLLAIAQNLDDERRDGKLRGPLHGIPYIVKDVFITHPDTGMPTTAGAPAFTSSKAKRTAPLLGHLADSGLILLGKTNLTEFCGIKHKGNTMGWSPAGGQTQNPYIFGGLQEPDDNQSNSSMTGSSSGTAAGVAAGFAPLGIGTECVGSIVFPATRGGLYALKARPNLIDAAGCFGYTDCLDGIGGMAKTANDLNLFMSSLLKLPKAVDVSDPFSGLRVGFVDTWRLCEDWLEEPERLRKTIETAYQDIKDKISMTGAKVIELHDFPKPSIFDLPDDKSCFYEIAFYQLPNKFFPIWLSEFSESEVHSWKDIIKYNEEHADVCLPPKLPNQGELHDLAKNFRVQEKSDEIAHNMQQTAKEALDKYFETCDILFANAEGAFCFFSSAGGLPIAAMPYATLKYSDKNERPFGFQAIAKNEELLLKFMAGYEAIAPARPLPKPLLQSS